MNHDDKYSDYYEGIHRPHQRRYLRQPEQSLPQLESDQAPIYLKRLRARLSEKDCEYIHHFIKRAALDLGHPNGKDGSYHIRLFSVEKYDKDKDYIGLLSPHEKGQTFGVEANEFIKRMTHQGILPPRPRHLPYLFTKPDGKGAIRYLSITPEELKALEAIAAAPSSVRKR